MGTGLRIYKGKGQRTSGKSVRGLEREVTSPEGGCSIRRGSWRVED